MYNTLEGRTMVIQLSQAMILFDASLVPPATRLLGLAALLTFWFSPELIRLFLRWRNR